MIFISLKKLRPLLVSLVIWLGLDLLTKELATFHLGERVEIIKNWFSFSLHHNHGVAFGISFGQWPQALLALGILVALGWMAVELAYGTDQRLAHLDAVQGSREDRTGAYVRQVREDSTGAADEAMRQMRKSYDRNRFLKLVLLGIIMGGAIGNLVNRVALGYVIDFIDLWPIPIFNLGDVGITVGLTTLLILSLKKQTGDLSS